MISIENKIVDLYSARGKYQLPSLRERDCAKLLKLIDDFNHSRITGAKIEPFYVKILQLAYISAHNANIEWQLDLQAQREIDLYLKGQSLDQNNE